MADLFATLLLISLIALIVGLIKPKVFSRLIKKTPTRKQVGLILGILTFTFFILFGIFAPPTEKRSQSIAKPQNQNEAINNQDNVQNQNEEVANQVDTQNQIVATTTEVQSLDSASANIAEVVQTQPAPTPVAQQQPEAKTVQPTITLYAVTSVVDGDTIKVDISGTVTTLRLIGMDTPETVDPRKAVQCFGKEASNKAKELLTGKKVRIEKDSSQGELDKYGRTLAYVYREDGLFYNKYMIEQGYAHEYTYSTPYKYQTEFKAAQKSAQENLRGLWSPNTCNGDTTQPAVSSIPNASNTNTNTSAAETQTTGKYYTSSYGSTKYYYPGTCSAWKSIADSKYLKTFDSLAALLAAYPSRTLSPQCQ